MSLIYEHVTQSMPCSTILSMTIQNIILAAVTSDFLKQMSILKSFNSVFQLSAGPLNAKDILCKTKEFLAYLTASKTDYMQRVKVSMENCCFARFHSYSNTFCVWQLINSSYKLINSSCPYRIHWYFFPSRIERMSKARVSPCVLTCAVVLSI